MIAVIFEVWPNAGQTDHYLDLAADLAPLLDGIDGFISIERFQSLAEPGKLLSLSFWRDEDAVAAWRNTGAHRATQAKGRTAVFRDYRLRIASVDRDYGLFNRDQAPADSKASHGVKRHATNDTLTRTTPPAPCFHNATPSSQTIMPVVAPAKQ